MKTRSIMVVLLCVLLLGNLFPVAVFADDAITQDTVVSDSTDEEPLSDPQNESASVSEDVQNAFQVEDNILPFGSLNDLTGNTESEESEDAITEEETVSEDAGDSADNVIDEENITDTENVGDIVDGEDIATDTEDTGDIVDGEDIATGTEEAGDIVDGEDIATGTEEAGDIVTDTEDAEGSSDDLLAVPDSLSEDPDDDFTEKETVSEEAQMLKVGQQGLVTSDGNWEYSVGDGPSIWIDKYLEKGKNMNVPIPAQLENTNVTVIKSNLFRGDTKLEKATFGEGFSMTSLPSGMFSGCTALSEVKLPENVTSVAEGTYGFFEDCDSLTQIPDLGGLTAIPASMFAYCDKLGSNASAVSIPGKITAIGAAAFLNCKNVIYITIPTSLQTIGNYAFKGCAVDTDYLSIFYYNTEAKWLEVFDSGGYTKTS